MTISIVDDASIAFNGAVLLGKNFTCDAHYERPVRIITHAHSDHLLNLTDSLKLCETVLATPITKEIIAILKEKELSSRITTLQYEVPYEFEKERVTLYPAHHIVGSAQVLVESKGGRRVLYTGDFKFPPATPIKADIIVSEATYGNPAYVRSFRDSVESEFIKLVKTSLKKGPVYIFGYHGKLQEVVKLLNESDITAPILVQEKVFRILQVCRDHGMELSNFFHSDSYQGELILDSPHIGLYHMGASKWFFSEGVKIILSGWQFDVPCKRVGENEYQVALSDHSDFEQLMEYFSASRPKLVITDNYRSGDAPLLAREIKRRLNINAIAMP
jgi:putative mRNA 3-end processing factor